MENSIILCVDDDTTVLTALRAVLGKHLGIDHEIEVAESGEEALGILDDLQKSGGEIGVVITDYIMPGMRGDELLVKLHERSPNTVKILLTGQSDMEGVKRAINDANLYRFIEKPFDNADVLMTAKTAAHAYQLDRELTRQNAELKRMNEELERLVEERTKELTLKNRELEYLSVTDSLTGLCNRLKLDQVLETEFARRQRYGTTFSAIMLDLDKFKSVNDQHGHQAGDRVLMFVADLLKKSTREVDMVGRWGGEEFLIVATNTDLNGAKEIAEKLRNVVAAHEFPIIGNTTASFGVSSCSSDDDTITALIKRADDALYLAKQKGRNRVESK